MNSASSWTSSSDPALVRGVFPPPLGPLLTGPGGAVVAMDQILEGGGTPSYNGPQPDPFDRNRQHDHNNNNTNTRGSGNHTNPG